MTRSLQEQLLEAGLATEDQQRKPRGGGRHRSRKPDNGKRKGSGAGRSSGNASKQPSAREQQRRAERAARQRRREDASRIAEIVDAEQLERGQAEVPYRFTRGRRIKETWVTRREQGRLARGEIALVASRGRYALVPVAAVPRIREIDADAVLVLADPDNDGPPDEEAASGHPVPDDLMW